MPTSRLLAGITGAIVLCLAAGADAAVWTHNVTPKDNLFHAEGWHGWSGGVAETEYGAPGTGVAARAVADGGGAVDFAGYDALFVTASGAVQDDAHRITGPEGSYWNFRDLPVYSLIGVWSTSAAAIDPIGSAFHIGAGGTIDVPDVASAFFFLGENDGWFHDNHVGAYNVHIAATPLPGAIVLMGAGLAALGGLRARARAAA